MEWIVGEADQDLAYVSSFLRLLWTLFCVLIGWNRGKRMAAHSPEDIQNNNVLVEPGNTTTNSTMITSNATTNNTLTTSTVITTATSDDTPTTTTTPTTITLDSASSSWVLAQLVARGLDTMADDSAPSSLTCGDEYLEDPLEDLTLENLKLPEDYNDPSLGYEFVGTGSSSVWGNSGGGRLDNCEALVRQLESLGVRVRDDYLTLDLDLSTSRSASVSSVSDEGSVGEDYSLPSLNPRLLQGSAGEDHSLYTHSRQSHGRGRMAPSPAGHILPGLERLWRQGEGKEVDDDEVFVDIMDEEVAEAEILPCGGVKVTYENYGKEYRPKISPHQNYLRFLQTVHSGGGSGVSGGVDDTPHPHLQPIGEATSVPSTSRSLEERYRRIVEALQRSIKMKDGRIRSLSLLPAKIKRLLAEEVTYDAVTPDSGVHDSFNQLSPEEQEKQREEWKAELAKTEEEIQTLRQVLGSKVRTAQDLKRRLGVTVWREFTEDFNNSMKSVRESQTVQKANEVISDIQEAVTSAPLYKKVSGAFTELGDTITQQPA
ncbi:hypothetical protein Pmani_037477 [Petrolisthes manimaculis]|uniref:Uncharacterized protein n=1 Tax=Petrolisthes manimaculis TaxID=1843537 RepID=A0AAE1TN98_9EUCA|nr:hypothetical protein Pmani_037477 [Petrolisthes manimaculis]